MNRPSDKTSAWELTAIVLAIVIIVSLPLYYFLQLKKQESVVLPESGPTFVGSAACKGLSQPRI